MQSFTELRRPDLKKRGGDMICSNCHKDKEFPEFSRGSVCRPCMSAQKKAYRAKANRKRRPRAGSSPKRVALSKVQDAQGRWHVNWGYR
jgi:hypothetical protein